MNLILNGGGTGDKVSNARKLLNNLINHNKKILYIPFAWPELTYSGCLEFMTRELSDVGKVKNEIKEIKVPFYDKILEIFYGQH